MRSLAPPFVLPVLLALSLVSCASRTATVVRDLPAGLAPIGAMLHSCEHASDADGSIVARCDDDVLFRVRTVEVEVGAPPRYFGDGVDLANRHAGRMGWETMQLKTAYDTGIVDRGDVRAVADDRVVYVVVGAARRTSTAMQTESSCEAPPESFDRCTALLTAFLDLPAAQTAPRLKSGKSSGAIAGRSLSLPTWCVVDEETSDHGRYSCEDGARLFWMLTDDMADAAAQAEGAILAQADGDLRKPVRCALADADTQCEATPTALVGLGYLDGRPLVVLCSVPADAPSSPEREAAGPFDHGLCKSAFGRR